MFASGCDFLFDDSSEDTSKDSNDWDNIMFFLALVEFKGQLFRYLDNMMRLNYIGEGM